MAVDFNVMGPCLVETDIVLMDGTLAQLGYTPNDQLVSWTVEHGSVRLTSSRGGTAPLDAVYTGSIVTLDLVLEEFDMGEWKELMQPPGSTVDGKVGIPGSRWNQSLANGGKVFQLKLQPVDRAGSDTDESEKRPATTFPVCFIDGPNAGRLFDHGNESTKAGLSITAIANSLDQLWTLIES